MLRQLARVFVLGRQRDRSAPQSGHAAMAYYSRWLMASSRVKGGRSTCGGNITADHAAVSTVHRVLAAPYGAGSKRRVGEEQIFSIHTISYHFIPFFDHIPEPARCGLCFGAIVRFFFGAAKDSAKPLSMRSPG
jgi:hypothetical protein